MSLLDGINKQGFVSDRIPMPVDIVSDTAYVNSITGETVQLYYFANAYLTCAAAGETTASNWAALAATSSFQIDFNGKTYIITPDFTGDASMANVAASIQTALRAVGGALATVTCAYSTDHFVITTIKDESGADMANSISVLSNPSSNTGTDIAGSSWMNGKYGSGVVTPATLTTDAGEAAGTIVMAKLAYSGILDKLGAMVGNHKDSSLTWTTGTVLPSKYIKPCPKYKIESVNNVELVDIAYDIVKEFTTNGEWCLDHRTGTIFGRKASTGTSDTAAYKVQSQATGGGSSISSVVKVSDGTDVLDVLVQDAAFGTASKGLAVFGKYMATPTTYTDGDAVPILLDANGRIALSSDIQIGAVELKDASTDTRAIINDANTGRSTATDVLCVQAIDSAGAVLATSALATSANLTAKTQMTQITDGTNEADVIATINSLKADISSVAGSTTPVSQTDGLLVNLGSNNDVTVTGSVTATVAAPTTLTGGSKTVTAAGTAEALGTTLASKSIYIRAKSTNTSFVCIGDSNVDEATNQQVVLYANDFVSIEIANRATVYVDADVNGEGVDYLVSS